MPHVDDILARLAAPSPLERHADVDAWWSRHRALEVAGPPVDSAILGSLRTDRLGWAFAGAYQAALRALVPGLDAARLASFAVTEAGGNHPRAIETTLLDGPEGLVLDGSKAWVTLGPTAGTLIVVARLSTSADAPRPSLRAVRLDAARPGVTIEPRAVAPFVPEIPHATARFDAVSVGAVDLLPGDGWDDYARPFRTVEDAHVLAAVLAWLAALAARHDLARDVREDLLGATVAARTLALADPRAPATHLALAGLFRTLDALLVRLEPEWPKTDPPTREAWTRDRPLLDVAARARARRTAKAWSTFHP